MNKQQLETWLFPPVEKFEHEPIEKLTNKKFILMVTVGIAFITIMRVLFH